MSDDIVIRAEKLGKLYRIGEREKYQTLRDRLGDALASPFRLLAGHRNGHRPSAHIWALKDVSFDVRRGEVVGIIGRNGAGKSTLLKILSRITEPTEGWAEIRGRVGSLLEVGTGFHPELTGRENIFLNGAILGMKKAEIVRNFDAIVAFAEIEQFIDTPVKHYSSGMYLRLAFAVAAHLDTEVLFVDEVLAVGDAAFQKKCLGKMSAVSRQGRTVLLVSHQMDAIRELAHHVIWIDEGKLHAEGNAREMVSSYLRSSNGDDNHMPIQQGSCTLTKVAVVQYGRECGRQIEARHPWGVAVDYRLNGPLNTGVALRFTNERGIVVFDVHEYIAGAPTRDAGTYRTTFDLSEIPLAPGSYSVNVYLMVHKQAVHLVAEHCYGFGVIGTVSGYMGTTIPFDLEGVLLANPVVSTVAVCSGSDLEATVQVQAS